MAAKLKDIHHHSPKQIPNICHLHDPPHFSLVVPLTLDQKYFAIVLQEFAIFSPDMRNFRIGVKCFHFEILYIPLSECDFFIVQSMQITFPFEINNTE